MLTMGMVNAGTTALKMVLKMLLYTPIFARSDLLEVSLGWRESLAML